MSEWHDWLGAQTVEAEPHTPSTAKDIVDIVSGVAADADFVRGVGAGHSTSPVAQPMQRSHWVDLRRLNRTLPWTWYVSERVDPDFPFLRVEAGITIRELNQRLDGMGLALPTMGSYDAQTIAGVISTATHGSGIGHSPISDLVEAIEIVTFLEGDVKLVRIEPSDGITDADAYYASDDPMPLIQDDDAFYSAVVGLGMFGIVYAVTLRARRRFWLHEHRSLIVWDELKPRLPALVADNPMYFDITFLPHTLVDDYAGKILCQLTTREELPYKPNPPARQDYGDALAMAVAVVGTGLLEWLALDHRESYKRQLVAAFRARAAIDQSSASYIISRTSLGDKITATSCEQSVPIERAADAIDALIALAAQHENDTDPPWFHTSPVGVRFGRPSKHYLAPAYGRQTCYLECPLLVSVRTISPEVRAEHERYREHMLSTIETTLMGLGSRPHWGQRNYAAAGQAQALYPKFATWREQRRRFDPNGVFLNAFGTTLGLP